MAIYPSGKYLPIKHLNKPIVRYRGVIWHVDGGNATTLYSYFKTLAESGSYVSSHFYVKKNGEVEQYIDTKYQSMASVDANPTTIAIETQGYGTEKWTTAQQRSLVKLTRWLCKTHNIPMKRMKSSHSNQTGIGTHRLGIDGNFPKTGVQRGRIQRPNAIGAFGEKWSTAIGKVCPGDARQAQWPELVKRIGTFYTNKATVGQKGTAFYKGYKTDRKAITRVLPTGRKIRATRFSTNGKWVRTKKGDKVKVAKLRAEN